MKKKTKEFFILIKFKIFNKKNKYKTNGTININIIDVFCKNAKVDNKDKFAMESMLFIHSLNLNN